MNKVLIVGRVAADSETKEFNNSAKTSFRVATNESYKDKNGEWQKITDWHNVELWRNRNILKGTLVSVEGSLKTDKYEDKDGNTRYRAYIKASRVDALIQPEQSASAGNNYPDASDNFESEFEAGNGNLPF